MSTTPPARCLHCGASIAAQDQPGVCPQCGQAIAVVVPEAGQPAPPAGPDALSDGEVLTIVSDTLVGPNVRLKDNLYQAIAIGVCLLVGAATGAAIGFFANTEERALATVGGAVLGGFLGMVLGLLGSGAFLAFYRLLRHLRGRHD